jgi:hypothetical protein
LKFEHNRKRRYVTTSKKKRKKRPKEKNIHFLNFFLIMERSRFPLSSMSALGVPCDF